MDLGAYTQIDDLEAIAKANGIGVSRLRGYRLMKDEKPISKDELDNIVKSNVFHAAENEIRTDEYGWIVGSRETDRKCRKLLIGKKESWYIEITGINWSKIHGKLRKRIKFAMKKAKKNTLTQWNIWNKYAGRDDVLYIHAKEGSCNWSSVTWRDYQHKHWYLDGCDDAEDKVYCDIYAKIDLNKRKGE